MFQFASPKKSLLAMMAAASALVGIMSSSALAASHSQTPPGDDTNTINAMIQALSPQQGYGHTYGKKIITVPVPIYTQHQPYAQGQQKVIYQPILLNYNHTYDLAVFFDFDRATIKPEARALLNSLGHALISPGLSHSTYLLAGHTDAKGSDTYNLWLSNRRAEAVKWYLTSHFPIAPHRLITAGFGESRLADPAHPRAGINRRVEITLIDQGYIEQGNLQNIPSPKVIYPQGNPNCDPNTSGYLQDSRPADQNLDDFNTPRLPVECLNNPDAPVVVVPVPAPVDTQNSPKILAPADPTDTTNSIIGN